MASRDRHAAKLAEALVYRLRNRGDGPGQFPLDDELFTQEFMTVLIGFGWRHVEVLTVHDWRDGAAGDGLPVSDQARQEVEALRAQLAARSEP